MRPWTDGITLPVLIDPQHVLTELYAISNVPTVIWIDEDDRIVRPNSVAFSTDMFAEFTGAHAGPHLDALRAWVRRRDDVDLRRRRPRRGARPDRRRGPGRQHFRIATEARRRGDDGTARRHFVRAGELAPMDFTIRRAALPLTGGDPSVRTSWSSTQEW